MYLYIYKSRKDDGKYIFELFNEWEERKPNCRLLNDLDFYLDDIVDFKMFTDLIEFIVGTRSESKTKESFSLDDDVKIDRRIYYCINGLDEKVLKEKINSYEK